MTLTNTLAYYSTKLIMGVIFLQCMPLGSILQNFFVISYGPFGRPMILLAHFIIVEWGVSLTKWFDCYHKFVAIF